MTLQIIAPELPLSETISRNCLLCKFILKINQHSFKCKKNVWGGNIQVYSKKGHLTGTCHEYRIKTSIKLI